MGQNGSQLVRQTEVTFATYDFEVWLTTEVGEFGTLSTVVSQLLSAREVLRRCNMACEPLLCSTSVRNGNGSEAALRR